MMVQIHLATLWRFFRILGNEKDPSPLNFLSKKEKFMLNSSTGHKSPKKIDWKKLDPVDVVLFSGGLMSGENFYKRYKNTPVGGMVRSMLRERGVDGARKIARYAKRRILAKQV